MTVKDFPPIDKGVPMPVAFKGKWINYLNAMSVGDSCVASRDKVRAMRQALTQHGSDIKLSWKIEGNTYRVWRRK